jgi:hypothetical protein
MADRRPRPQQLDMDVIVPMVRTPPKAKRRKRKKAKGPKKATPQRKPKPPIPTPATLWAAVHAAGKQPRKPLSERVTYVHADAAEWIGYLPDNSIHAIVTDPPYGLIEYNENNHAKMRNGRGGVWRIPPTLDGVKRSPLPRFTVLSDTERAALTSSARWQPRSSASSFPADTSSSPQIRCSRRRRSLPFNRQDLRSEARSSVSPKRCAAEIAPKTLTKSSPMYP